MRLLSSHTDDPQKHVQHLTNAQIAMQSEQASSIQARLLALTRVCRIDCIHSHHFNALLSPVTCIALSSYLAGSPEGSAWSTVVVVPSAAPPPVKGFACPGPATPAAGTAPALVTTLPCIPTRMYPGQHGSSSQFSRCMSPPTFLGKERLLTVVGLAACGTAAFSPVMTLGMVPLSIAVADVLALDAWTCATCRITHSSW